MSWKHGRHPAFQEQHNLTDERIVAGHLEFHERTQHLMLPREQQSIWLELCKQRKNKKKRLHSQWENTMLVSDSGSNIGWLSIAQGA
ncbi:MAG: hypothetical protein ACKPKO_62810, partial [Candidatus Fonsibacter sp.]